MTSMLHAAAIHLDVLGVDYVPLHDAWDRDRLIGYVVRGNTAPVRIDSLDDEMHLRVRPADEDGSAIMGGLEVHAPSPALVRAAIDAVLEYTSEGVVAP